MGAPRLTLAAALATALVTGSGCISDTITVAARPPAHYEKLGRTNGKACGVVLFYSTIYSILPIMMGSRVERAQAEALAKKPGATALMNTEIWGNWFWWIIGTTYCTSIEGEAIREVAAAPEPAAPPDAVPAPEPAPPSPPTPGTTL